VRSNDSEKAFEISNDKIDGAIFLDTARHQVSKSLGEYSPELVVALQLRKP
jgi:hypothetical protein